MAWAWPARWTASLPGPDRKSTRLNSSHANISYAVFCLKKKHTAVRGLVGEHEAEQNPVVRSILRPIERERAAHHQVTRARVVRNTLVHPVEAPIVVDQQ